MSTLHTWQTILEIGMVAFIIWGLFNEDKFIRFETRIKKLFKKN